MMHTEIIYKSSLQQNRHRVLCNILCTTEAGQNLVERARRLGFPVDWSDQRIYPSRPGYSDYGATLLLAKDVAKAETLQQFRVHGKNPDFISLDTQALRQAQQEAMAIFNSLHTSGVYLSGYVNGRFFTCQQAMPWWNADHASDCEKSGQEPH